MNYLIIYLSEYGYLIIYLSEYGLKADFLSGISELKAYSFIFFIATPKLNVFRKGFTNLNSLVAAREPDLLHQWRGTTSYLFMWSCSPFLHTNI